LNTIDSQLKEISQKLLNENLVNQRFIADENSYSQDVDDSLRQWRENLVEIFSYSISEDIETTYNRLKIWGSDAVNLLVNLDLSLDLAIEEVRFYRNIIGEVIKNEAVNHNFSLDTFYEIISRFDSVVDRAIFWLSISYSNKYLSRIQAAETLALELSVPVIPVTSEIGVLPLIGDIDTNRAQQMMERALSQGAKLGLHHLVIDLSGVPIIDTMVAKQIFKVISALNLLGIKVSLSGIRPEIAQTMVQLGLNFNEIKIFANLHQAIKQFT